MTAQIVWIVEKIFIFKNLPTGFLTRLHNKKRGRKPPIHARPAMSSVCPDLVRACRVHSDRISVLVSGE